MKALSSLCIGNGMLPYFFGQKYELILFYNRKSRSDSLFFAVFQYLFNVFI